MQDIQRQDGAYLWRYTSFASLVAMLQTNTLRFASLAELRRTDRSEGMFSDDRSGYEEMMMLTPGYGEEFSFREDREHSERWFTRCFYANCWHTDTDESLAMWKMYGHEDGIAIRTTADRLTKAFCAAVHNVRIAPVQYRQPQTLEEHGLTKRPYFKFEEEIRAYVYLPMQSMFAVKPELFVEVDPTILMESVFVSPTKPWLQTVVMKHLNDCHNINIPVLPSGV